jgi:5-methylcytosine-specific restriction protein A
MKLVWDSQGKMPEKKIDGKYQRERSDWRYHTNRWTRLSRSWRAEHPLCKRCAANGIIKPAQHTDHIVPWPVCGDEGFFSRSNLQSLCADCNNLKGQEDKAVIQRWRREQRGRGV